MYPLTKYSKYSLLSKFDCQCCYLGGLGYFESTLVTEIRLWSAFAISEESRIFVFAFLNGSGSGSESLVCGVE